MIHTTFLGSNNHKKLWEGQAPVLTKGMLVRVEDNPDWGTHSEMMRVWEAYVSIAGSDVPNQTVYLEPAKW